MAFTCTHMSKHSYHIHATGKTPRIPILSVEKHKGHDEFKDTLSYIMRPSCEVSTRENYSDTGSRP